MPGPPPRTKISHNHDYDAIYHITFEEGGQHKTEVFNARDYARLLIEASCCGQDNRVRALLDGLVTLHPLQGVKFFSNASHVGWYIAHGVSPQLLEEAARRLETLTADSKDPETVFVAWDRQLNKESAVPSSRLLDF